MNDKYSHYDQGRTDHRSVTSDDKPLTIPERVVMAPLLATQAFIDILLHGEIRSL